MAMSDDESKPHKPPPGGAGVGRGGRGGMRPEARDNNRRLLQQIGELVSDDRWLAAAALACCFVGAPIQVVQFIYAGDSPVASSTRACRGAAALLFLLHLHWCAAC